MLQQLRCSDQNLPSNFNVEIWTSFIIELEFHSSLHLYFVHFYIHITIFKNKGNEIFLKVYEK